METSIQKYRVYLYKDYQDDLDLAAFVAGHNSLLQQYLDLANSLNLPIYTQLSGAMLDWIGASFYGLTRPLIGNPSGAIYNAFKYNQAIYGTGAVSPILASDDAYKRVLTWMNFRGDGFYSSMEWLKRRIKRFLIGINGAAPWVDNTYEVSISIGVNNALTVVINYPSDPGSVKLACIYLNSGVLSIPFQYPIFARSA